MKSAELENSWFTLRKTDRRTAICCLRTLRQATYPMESPYVTLQG